MTPLLSHYIGLDLGKSQDPSAIAVVERRDYAERPLPELVVRYLTQFHLGTSYIRVQDDITRMTASKKLQHAVLVADATGPGAPVMDQFREADVPLLAVIIGGGESRAHRLPDGTWRVTKKDLVGVLQVLLAQRRLIVPESLGSITEMLKAQLRGMQTKITKAGNETFEHRSGEHDDLALALALACWAAERTAGALGDQRDDENQTDVAKAPEGVFWH